MLLEDAAKIAAAVKDPAFDAQVIKSVLKETEYDYYDNDDLVDEAWKYFEESVDKYLNTVAGY